MSKVMTTKAEIIHYRYDWEKPVKKTINHNDEIDFRRAVIKECQKKGWLYEDVIVMRESTKFN